MRFTRDKQLQRLVLGCCILLLPVQQVLAVVPSRQGRSRPAGDLSGAVVRDVELQPGHVFAGQVLDQQGAACQQTPVRLVPADGAQAQIAVTDPQGRFRFADVPAGVYRVETRVGSAMYRLWAPQTAPPAAGRSALILQGDPTVRANLGNIGPLGWTLIGLGVAAAIAVPLVLDDDDDVDDAS